jgi:hypothetical protein
MSTINSRIFKSIEAEIITVIETNAIGYINNVNIKLNTNDNI